MNMITELLRQPVVETLGWTLLHFLWQGAVVAGLLFLLQALLQRASSSARYLAACLALLAMALAPLLTFSYLREPSLPIIKAVAVSTLTEDAIVGVSTTAPASARGSVFAAPRNDGLREHVQRLLPWVVAAWLLAVSLLSLRLLAGWLYVNKLKNRATEPLGERWQTTLMMLAEQLEISRPVQLVKSLVVEVPTVIGWLRPVILLPASSLTSLSPSQLEAIIAHELAHIRRHDYLINLVQSVVETLLFYHPAVWWVSRQISLERENCCDDLTVKICGDRIAYAKTLATLEELRQASTQLSIAATGGSLLYRIRRLLGVATPANRSGWSVAALLLLAAFAVIFVAPRGALFAADATRSQTGANSALSKASGEKRSESPTGVKEDQLTAALNCLGRHESVVVGALRRCETAD